MPQFDNVSVIKKANVYFDGKCVSHTVILAGGVRKSVGVILPSTLTFNTDAPERMEIMGVTDRGVFYDIPTSHLNVPLKSLIPHELARLALDHYKSSLNAR